MEEHLESQGLAGLARRGGDGGGGAEDRRGSVPAKKAGKAGGILRQPSKTSERER
jgi:hypothetical protein